MSQSNEINIQEILDENLNDYQINITKLNIFNVLETVIDYYYNNNNILYILTLNNFSLILYSFDLNNYKILEKCKINVSSGCFHNNILYILVGKKIRYCDLCCDLNDIKFKHYYDFEIFEDDLTYFFSNTEKRIQNFAH